LFLRRECTVYGVEPNPEMRRAAERRLRGYPRFVSVAGTGEATTLPDASVDVVTVAQALHWLDRQRARREFVRILRPGGAAAVFWNWRRPAGTPFLDAYEALLVRYGTDYGEVRRRYEAGAPAGLRAFFGGPYRTWRFAHAHALDLGGVMALLLSTSYTPAADHPDRAPMLRELGRAFATHARAGRVEILYDTELHWGPIADTGRRAVAEV
jgi:SAM-dependent methyltransferase